ncbi:low temperature requirement protein A [Thiofilum flexile]|uniref:low temperature requirement protein A n=1 Tax=Thiofilum flexile TaxID=125627 RepID=UPI00037FA75B|nr:low temperature requirement protein A [Thiofilum flexile]
MDTTEGNPPQHSRLRLDHHLRRMTGRNQHEHHRAATPLELLYDLTLVVAFGVAGSQMAHALAEGHIWVGVAGFIFTMFAAVWAWVNFTWFASAYDTDDWFMRLAVMMQMAGVMVLALGVPDLFHGLEAGTFHNQVMVGGYVVMRLALVALWLRAALSDPPRRKVCLGYAVSIALAQVGWVVLALCSSSLPFGVLLVLAILILCLEFVIPYLVETRFGGTPWHPHHIAERYGLLAIIALGEGIIGTVSALEALISKEGWSGEAVSVLTAGLMLTMGCWWVYFNTPFGNLLAYQRRRAYLFGYSHLLVYMSIAAIGAGLHVAAYYVQGTAHIGITGMVFSVALPTGIFISTVYLLGPLLSGVRFQRYHLLLMLVSFLVLLAGVLLAAIGAGLSWSLGVIMLAPWVTVIAFEAFSHQNVEQMLLQESELASKSSPDAAIKASIG